MAYPPSPIAVPWISVAEMVEVDRLMIEVFGVELLQMMENAGRALADVARRRFLGGDPRGRRVVVVAGGGGNGGGGMAAARRLAIWGADVVVVAGPVSSPATARQRDTLGVMGVPILAPEELDRLAAPDLVIDAVLGYSLRGAPAGAPGEMVAWASGVASPILALDVPSGVDADSGETHLPHVDADATLTLALPKRGLGVPASGELYLADIGVPPLLYRRLGYEVGPVFATSDVVALLSH